jgi:hypothetical protein
MAEPPLLAGAVNVTVACAFPIVAIPIVGGSGTVEGVTAFEAELARPVPFPLVAFTVKVYVVPLDRPATVIGLAEPEPVSPPGLEVTVYPVMAEPPSLVGPLNVTDACAFPAVAIPIVGAPGTVEGITEFEAALAGPVPMEFVAVTVKVYVVPLIKPFTVIGLDEPVPTNPLGLDVTV